MRRQISLVMLRPSAQGTVACSGQSSGASQFRVTEVDVTVKLRFVGAGGGPSATFPTLISTVAVSVPPLPSPVSPRS